MNPPNVAQTMLKLISERVGISFTSSFVLLELLEGETGSCHSGSVYVLFTDRPEKELLGNDARVSVSKSK